MALAPIVASQSPASQKDDPTPSLATKTRLNDPVERYSTASSERPVARYSRTGEHLGKHNAQTVAPRPCASISTS